jgi:hypothetical protein
MLPRFTFWLRHRRGSTASRFEAQDVEHAGVVGISVL